MTEYTLGRLLWCAECKKKAEVIDAIKAAFERSKKKMDYFDGLPLSKINSDLVFEIEDEELLLSIAKDKMEELGYL